MNRLLFCIILLLTGQSAVAEKLYRWIEPDGSITFSPIPPPAGTDYKTVNAAHNNAAKADLPASDQKPATLANSETDQKPSIPATSETDQKPSIPATTETVQKPAILATSETDQKRSNLATSETDQKRSILATSEHGLDVREPKNNTTEIVAQPAPAVERQKLSYAPDTGSDNTTPPAATESGQSAESQTDSVADSKKRRQCEDLNKRVLSLERRLRTPLEPIDMDNTVVAMARYQRSYDQHCIE